MASGCDNIKLRDANSEIHKVALKDIVTSPPEKGLWAEVSGALVDQSYVMEDKAGYVLLSDPESKMAIFVKVVENSTLLSKSNEKRVVRGMIKTFEGAAKLPKKNVPADLKVANLVLEEDETPPSWLASWGLLILGFIIIGGPSGSRVSRST
jgi:hypothetical protein